MAKRTTYTATFKGKVAIQALKENKALIDLSQEFSIHPAQITKWKSQAIKDIAIIFEDGRKKKSSSSTPNEEELYAQIGKLQAKLEFLKKKTGIE